MNETSNSGALLSVHEVSRHYQRKVETIAALEGVSFTVERAEHVALLGPSGSGKTTLLNLIAGLDQPTSGNVSFRGIDLHSLPEPELVRLRAQSMGFVFQDFGIVRSLSALDNVCLPMVLAHQSIDVMRAKASLEHLGLQERLHHFPNELSRGELQRVAIARALVLDPELILADEPTGSLDAGSTATILAIFEELRRSRNVTVMIATHDRSWAERADRVIRLRRGRLEQEIP